MANYYDRVLEGFDEGILDDSYDEGVLDEAYDEGVFTNDRRRRPLRVPGSIGKSSDFGRRITAAPSASSSGNYATKAELKSSLNSISEQVNDLKKSSLTIASSVKRLDEGYEKVVKSIARKDKAQDSVMGNTTMMTLLGTIINKPTLDPAALKFVPDAQIKDANGTVTGTVPAHIEQIDKKDAIQVDLNKTLLFTMMPTMMSGNSSGSDNNMMMPLMMVLLLNKPKDSTSGSSLGSDDNTLVLVMMMMMMGKK